MFIKVNVNRFIFWYHVQTVLQPTLHSDHGTCYFMCREHKGHNPETALGAENMISSWKSCTKRVLNFVSGEICILLSEDIHKHLTMTKCWVCVVLLCCSIRCSISCCSGDCLYMSESDICRRQILTYKDGPHIERIKTFIMAVDQ